MNVYYLHMDVEHYDTVAAVAAITETPRSTIRSAIERGEIRTKNLAGGTVVVSVEQVRAWKQVERRPGRPA